MPTTEPSAALMDASHIPAPAPTDCNSPVFWDGDTMYMFNSVGKPRRSSGPSLDKLGNTIDCTWDGPPDKSWWIEAVWYDNESGTLCGWYHHEPRGVVPGTNLTAPKIGAIVSQDKGITWQDKGWVLDTPYPINPEDDNGYFVGGNGDFDVILDPDRQYFYFLFSTYAGPVSAQGVCIARSAFRDRGQPGTVFKYCEGKWDQPGLDGKFTPIFTTSVGWRGPTLDCRWGPSVHWNHYLRQYVVLLNRALRHGWKGEEIEIAFSEDLVHWTAPQTIYKPGGDILWYPTIVGVEKGESDTRCGRLGRFYISAASKWTIQFFKPGER